MCAFFEVSRASYYAWVKRSDLPDLDRERMKLVDAAYRASRRSYGYRRIKIWIEQKHGLEINHKAVLRLMNKMGIQSVARRKKPYRKWFNFESNHRYENILKQDFQAKEPNQKWTTDITYVPTKQGWAYLCVIKDLFDGFIVSHYLSKRPTVTLVTKTLKMALEKEMVTDGMILHSDQGLQYCSHAYYVLTKEYRIIPSMSRRGNCWDNAPVENFFGHLKEECLRQYGRLSFPDVSDIIDEYIDFYNYARIQLKTKKAPFARRCLVT
jgi:transposase InsO family protein